MAIRRGQQAVARGLVWLGGLGAVVAVDAAEPACLQVVNKEHPVSTANARKPAVLDRLGDKHRPILVFGPAADDSKVTRQGKCWVGPLPEAGIKDRDIVILEVPGQGAGKNGDQVMTAQEAKDLREFFKVEADAFAVVLVGRDGGEKHRWTEVVSAQEIFGKIDAMPMRQREVDAKGGGSE